MPQLEKLAPGTRIVSHNYDIEGTLHDGRWAMQASDLVEVMNKYDASVPEDWAHYTQVEHRVYLWVAPLKWKAGDAGAGR